MSEAMSTSHREMVYLKDSARTAVMVLGMHRSGTSALTRLLNLLGCDQPNTLMPAADSNAHGFWESLPITALNDEILNSAGSSWKDWQEFNPNWIKSSAFNFYMKRGIRLIEQEFGDSHLFVLKDPRNCVLMPFWRAVLDNIGINPVAIHTVRHPLEVIESVQKRDNHNSFNTSLLWLRYNISAENYTREMPRYFTSYDEILNNTDNFVENSQKKLGIYWPRNSKRSKSEISKFLSGSSRHHSHDMDDMCLLPPYSAELVENVYSILHLWAKDGESTEAGIQKIDEVSREFVKQVPVYERICAEIGAVDAKVKALEEVLRQREVNLAVAESERDESRNLAVLLTKERDDAQRLCAEIRAQASDREQELKNKLFEHIDTIGALRGAINNVVMERLSISDAHKECLNTLSAYLEEKDEYESILRIRFEEISELTRIIKERENSFRT